VFQPRCREAVAVTAGGFRYLPHLPALRTEPAHTRRCLRPLWREQPGKPAAADTLAPRDARLPRLATDNARRLRHNEPETPEDFAPFINQRGPRTMTRPPVRDMITKARETWRPTPEDLATEQRDTDTMSRTDPQAKPAVTRP
jgi:hypothetical protein